jgi:hypothetical protein
LAEDREESLLKEGHDVRVNAQGKDGRVLTVKWSQMGAQFVYKFTADDRLIKKLQNAGFRHIHFDNGDRFWDQDRITSALRAVASLPGERGLRTHAFAGASRLDGGVLVDIPLK